MTIQDDTPKLYAELSAWWPLLSAPEDYAEEARIYRRALEAARAASVGRVVELGSGGGNNASHLKAHWDMTLVDRSEGMLAVSRALNPECAHVLGDMRTVRLEETFDAVFVHDAVSYLTTEADLRAALATAYVHCQSGGAALFAPDAVRETFRPYTKHGGHDGAGRALRYLEWVWDPDPAGTTCICDFAYLLQEGDRVRVEHDRHVVGLFPRATWLARLREVGFEPSAVPFEHGEVEDPMEFFLARKPR